MFLPLCPVFLKKGTIIASVRVLTNWWHL